MADGWIWLGLVVIATYIGYLEGKMEGKMQALAKIRAEKLTDSK